MDKKARLVVKGYYVLNKSQQKEVADAIKDYDQRGIVNEEIKKTEVGMGPTGTTCPCCGRS
jgi:hypothetical protein